MRAAYPTGLADRILFLKHRQRSCSAATARKAGGVRNPAQLLGAGNRVIRQVLGVFPFQLAAALSFYTVLSLSPLVLVVVAAAGLVLGDQPVRTELLSRSARWSARQSRDRAHGPGEHDDQRPAFGSMIVGIITLLFGATTVFAQLQSSLNQIWM